MALLDNFFNFSESFKELYKNTDLNFLELEGIAPNNLDISGMSNRYFSERVSDMSVDDNANHLQDGRSFGNYISEMSKSSLKILGYHDLHKILANDYTLMKFNEYERKK